MGGWEPGAGAGAGYYRGRCPLCFPRLGWRRSAKPNPGQSSSAATLGFPRAVSSASPLSEASAVQLRPVEANRQEAGGVCLSGEASVNIGWEKVEADRGGQVMRGQVVRPLASGQEASV